MSRIRFLEKYAIAGRHYDLPKEIDRDIEETGGFNVAHRVDLTPDQITKVIDHSHKADGWKEDHILQGVAFNPNTTQEHIRHVVDKKSADLLGRFMDKADDKTIEHIIKSLKRRTSELGARHINNIEHANAALASEHPYTKAMGLRSKHTPDSVLEKHAAGSDGHAKTIAIDELKSRRKMDDMLRELDLDNLKESLDSNLKGDPLPPEHMLHQMGEFSASMVGGSNFKMHPLGDDYGFLIQFDKGGNTEVHHIDKDLSGGSLNGKKGTSVKMVSTFKHHIKDLLDSGKTVKISAHHNLANKFLRLTDKTVSKYPGYEMSEPSDEAHELTGDKLTTWTIRKNGQ